MFEQSLLAAGASARKPASLAVSLTIQTALVVIALAVPMWRVATLEWKPQIILYAPPLVKPPELAVIRENAPQHESALRPVYQQPAMAAPHRIPMAIADINDLGLTPPLTSSGSTGLPAATWMLPEPGLPEAARAGKAADGGSTAAPPKSGPMRVSKGVQMAKLLREVRPIYPSLARAARIEGTVRLRAIIAKDGTIRNLQLLSGHALLAQASLDAVRQWLYAPTMLSGEPVEVETEIDVTFTLAK